MNVSLHSLCVVVAAQTPENAKIILGTAIQHLQHSVKIWLQAAELETDVKARKRVLRRGTLPCAIQRTHSTRPQPFARFSAQTHRPNPSPP